MRAIRGRILVIRGGSIREFVLTLPALAALRSRFPEAHLELLGYPHMVQLAQSGGLVDRAQPIEARELAGFFAAGGNLNPAMADFFARFDIILSYLFDPDLVFQANVARCTKARFIKGPHRPDEGGRAHASAVFLKPLEQLAIYDADPVPRLNLSKPSASPDSGALAATSVCGAIALHPGGGERMNWPESKWIQLVERLGLESRETLMLVGGEAEEGRLDRLAGAVPAGRVAVARSLPLTELALRLVQCRAFVGHDSGISQLAAAVGLPVIVLCGGPAESVGRPPGDRVIVLRDAGGLVGLSVDRVVCAVRELFAG